jgi:hypothetical protein
MRRALAVTAIALAAAALISSCGSSSGLIPSATAGSLINDLGNIQAGVLAGDCNLTNQAIQTAETDFGELPASVDSKLRSQLSAGLSAVVIGAQRKCALNAGSGSTSSTGPTTATGPTGATTTTSSTTTSTSSSAATTTTTTTTTTSSAATTATSSAATTGTQTTCTTSPAGGTVCGPASGATSTNGIGGGAGAGGN